MPLFESQRSRNDRWFGLAQYATHKVMDEAFGNEPEARTHLAWAEAGMHLARFGVERLRTLKRAWGKGSVESATALTVLFTANMISRWYRPIRADRSADEEARAVEIAVTNIHTLLGQERRDDIADFMKMHAQFNYECNWIEAKACAPPPPEGSRHWGDVFQNVLAYVPYMTPPQQESLLGLAKLQAVVLGTLGVMPSKDRPGVIVWGYQLTIDKALVACGERPAIDWRLQAFPVRKSDDLRWLPGRNLGGDVASDFAAWLGLLGEAQQKMFEVYKLLGEGASS